MIRLHQRRSSVSFSVVGFLLQVSWLIGARIFHASFCEGSSLINPEIDDDKDKFVPPIVNREIKVAVEAKWPSSSEHSVLCEAFLFLKGDHSFLDALVSSHGRDHLVTFERSTQYALELAAGLDYGENFDDSPDAMNSKIRLLKVALTMRAMAPACELHRSIAHGRYPEHVEFLETFGVITYNMEKNNGTTAEFIVETSAEIPKSHTLMPIMTTRQRNELLLPNEVIRQGSEVFVVNKDDDENDVKEDTEMTAGVVILYTQLGGISFTTFYRSLVEREIPFVVRHMGSVDDDQAKTVLQGYGVRLDIRNVEYKVFDDKRTNDVVTTEDEMIDLTKIGDYTSVDASNGYDIDIDVEGACDASTGTCRPDDFERQKHLTSHFLAGVNVTALYLMSSGDGSQTSPVEELQRNLWKLHSRFQQHNQLIPPVWQRRRLSIQAATSIASSRDPLFALQDISQNLPSMASTLVHVNVPEEIQDVADSMEPSLQRLIKVSGGGFWINGRAVNIERPSFNVFELIQLLQNEIEELEELERRLKPTLSSLNMMRAFDHIQNAFSQGKTFFSEKDNSDEIENDPMRKGTNQQSLYRIDLATGDKDSVIYMNDLEKDKSYSHLSSSVKEMLMAMQYGMPPAVRRNLFTVLVVVDPLEDESATALTNYGQSLVGQLVQQQFPARLATVVVSQADVDICNQQIASGKICSVSMDHWLIQDHHLDFYDLQETKATARDIHRLYAYIRQRFHDHGQAVVMYQLYFSTSLGRHPPSNGYYYSLFDIFDIHNEILLGLGMVRDGERHEDIAKALQENERQSKFAYGKAVMFAATKGIATGMSFINGRPLPTKEDEAEKLQKIFNEEQELVFRMIMNEDITDTKPRNLYYKLIKGEKDNVYPRLHPLLIDAENVNSYLDIEHDIGTDSLLLPKSMRDDASALDADAIFVFEAFLALDTPKGLSLALEFLNIMENIPKTIGSDTFAVKYRIIPSTLNGANTDVCKVLNSAGKLGFQKTKELIHVLNENSQVQMDELQYLVDPSSCHDVPYLQQELPSENFITANGRIYNIDNASLTEDDVHLLMSMGLRSSKRVSEMLKAYTDDNLVFDAVGRTVTFLSAKNFGKEKRSGPFNLLASAEMKENAVENVLRFSWNNEEGNVDGLRTKVIAVVDPTTETAQRISPLLLVIRDELKLPLDLILAPRTELDDESDIPISSYYRFMADPSLYQVRGDSARSPTARFSNLPMDHILTLRMDVPEPWDVQQTYAIQDTDNLRCDLQSGCGDDAQTGIEKHKQMHITNVVYGLQHLLVFGRCYEMNLSTPNGLQLVLSERETKPASEAEKNSILANVEANGSIQMENDHLDSIVERHYSDTLVMKTVGYWQLRANPGIWDLKINEDSRGAEIFEMVEGQIKQGSVRVTNTIPSNKKQLVIRDFVGRGNGEVLLVKRKAGYEEATLFHEEETLASYHGDDVVHVFSLATGHLYERFLKIMMLSVTKRTSSKVKFWLFENFLSPTFKASSIAMAKKIGCEVEFVTYKWPEWLRGQNEKQRIIWGYKILFLDVLFPLNVKKIIYVDADQVIRGDLKELWDMDLNGAPYGYTPMCSSNEATLGFQFWNQGFWKNHLRGKPYHISALYVVDLEKFRKDRVGDILRAQYQALSADPGSLANLDQDLPNYAQHQVPIFSLPQEWLWCESWCSMETKAASKTIDLCNNPLHKEPKVSMAKRIISGDLFEESWIELDAQVGKYEDEYTSGLSA